MNANKILEAKYANERESDLARERTRIRFRPGITLVNANEDKILIAKTIRRDTFRSHYSQKLVLFAGTIFLTFIPMNRGQ